MTKKALLLIDIQNDYFKNGKMTLDNALNAGSNAALLLEHYRKHQWPVIHVQHIMEQPLAPFFVKDSQGAKTHKLVAPYQKEPVIIKHYPSSFRETTLKDTLDTLSITHLTIAGMMSNMCVDSTTRAACDLGYDCTVVHDACAAASLEFNGTAVPSQHIHTAFMAALSTTFATMVTTHEIISS